MAIIIIFFMSRVIYDISELNNVSIMISHIAQRRSLTQKSGSKSGLDISNTKDGRTLQQHWTTTKTTKTTVDTKMTQCWKASSRSTWNNPGRGGGWGEGGGGVRQGEAKGEREERRVGGRTYGKSGGGGSVERGDPGVGGARTWTRRQPGQTCAPVSRI